MNASSPRDGSASDPPSDPSSDPPGVATLLAVLDGLWDHPFESLVSVLGEIDAAEARWAPAGYPAGGPPLPGSVHWHVNHLAGCKLFYISVIEHTIDPSTVRRDSDIIAPLEDFAAELARLEEIHRAQRDTVAGLTDADLLRPTADGTPLVHTIVTQARHDTWHGGQIAMVRRLHRNHSPT